MELTRFSPHKNKIINILMIATALIASHLIYKKQTQLLESLRQEKDLEIRKNGVLENISQLEKGLIPFEKLLTEKDPSVMLNTLSNLAKEAGVRIVSIKPGAEQTNPDYLKLPFNLTISASSYHILGKFISRVENYQDVLKVDSLEIRSGGQEKEVTADLVVSSVVFTSY